jgi:protein-tyrosine phosphatase
VQGKEFRIMEVIAIDESRRLFLSPAIDDWKPIADFDITAIIDLDGDLDLGVPTIPNHMVYVYFPIYDEDLPDLYKLHAVAGLGAHLVAHGDRVLVHCGMGLNRSALIAGLILTYRGMKGEDAVKLLRSKRPGALFNDTFANYLSALPARPQ